MYSKKMYANEEIHASNGDASYLDADPGAI